MSTVSEPRFSLVYPLLKDRDLGEVAAELKFFVAQTRFLMPLYRESILHEYPHYRYSCKICATFKLMEEVLAMQFNRVERIVMDCLYLVVFEGEDPQVDLAVALALLAWADLQQTLMQVTPEEGMLVNKKQLQQFAEGRITHLYSLCLEEYGLRSAHQKRGIPYPGKFLRSRAGDYVRYYQQCVKDLMPKQRSFFSRFL